MQLWLDGKPPATFNGKQVIVCQGIVWPGAGNVADR
jgi:hypothetical protein